MSRAGDALMDHALEQHKATIRRLEADKSRLRECLNNLVGLAEIRGRLDEYSAALADARKLISET